MVGYFDYEQLVKATEAFSHSRLIGKGSHGSVYKGVLEGNKLVAIKKSSVGVDHVSKDNSKKLENEIRVLSSLRDRSPHIIKILGHSSQDSAVKTKVINKLLVMEFMPNGSLHDWLHVANTPPSWTRRVDIAIQIGRALHSLHERKPVVIHRDIKTANILLDSNWNSKLTDFGLAVMRLDSWSHQTTQPAGTMGYLDPCYTTPSKLSTKNDVFSYGVILLELISCRKVIEVSKVPASLVDWALLLIQKQRPMDVCDPRIALPQFMESTIRHLLYVAARCVSIKEETRPSISDVVMGLDNCMSQLVKVPSWTSLVRSMILMRRRRKANCGAQKCDVHNDISEGKILLREILADGSRLK
ncbi:hypothetical protein K2173_022193 [Erythroxylum novogranatense]|uniref:Protein kinase domain-containing protein n=1 Tax=Erythroxylum novogranatense TaxID=1862640 RepID=A0AAV8SUI3_9ROSI|nr:hypothetical protein K2173_022193 [Erythroxylum novogranatense]